MNVVKGFVRKGASVVNAEMTDYELIRQKRAHKRAINQTESELTVLRNMVKDLSDRVAKLEAGRG